MWGYSLEDLAKKAQEAAAAAQEEAAKLAVRLPLCLCLGLCNNCAICSEDGEDIILTRQ